MKLKYIFSAAILIGLFSCDDADSPIPEDVV